MRSPAIAIVSSVVVTLVGCGEDTATVDGDIVVADTSDVAADVLEPCAPALANQTRCAADGALESCIDGVWQPASCPGATRCDGGACLPVTCEPGVASCDDATTRAVCNTLGTRLELEPCAAGRCVDGQCVAGCVPGARRCDGLVVLECDEAGDEAPVAACDGASGEQCAGGRCLTACEVSGAKRGYVGCDYWAADLPNDESALDNIFAFAFSNVSPSPATVTVTYPWGPVHEVEVAVGGIATHALPVPRALSQIRAAGLGRFGFRIESDAPIAAFMFNPLERYDAASDATVATNDASILIPAPSLGTDYLAVTWSDPGQFSQPPFVTVVATRDDTTIDVTPTETLTIVQSPFVVPAGVATRFELDQHETLNLEPAAVAGRRTDLTGTRVTSTGNPIAVFSGNRCARVPDAGRFCDHVETQLPALETWGKELVVVKFTDRGGESDYLRILAQDDDTELTFDPPLPAPLVLGAGQHIQLPIDHDVVVSATRPVLVAQFMASQSMTTPPGPFGVSGSCPPEIGGTCQGDPALVLAAPVRQWLAAQVFLVPDTYRHQFIAIAFVDGTTLELDGEVIDTGTATAIGSGRFKSITVPTTGGYRTLIASQPVGVVVYGFDHNISYAYNGGLEFRNLRDE